MVGIQDVDAMLKAACAGGACRGPNDPFLTGQLAMVWNGNFDGCQHAAPHA
ncbi:MAG: hypothetical protein R3E79_20325 [Caldilineaceae bacterium]